MSNRTYICLDCRKAKRAIVAYGRITNYRCPQCQKPLVELPWRRRIPKSDDDREWLALRIFVAQTDKDRLPRLHAIGRYEVANIDRKIDALQSQKNPRDKERKLRCLLSQRRKLQREYDVEQTDSGNSGSTTAPNLRRRTDGNRPIKKGLEMKSRIVAVSVMILAANAGWAQVTNYPKAKVSFEDFKGLVAEVETHRATRLVDLNTFLKMSKEPGTIILDSRSAFRFDRIHLKGAKHLAFTDFTQDNLAKVIPTFETTILIYCNNNFEGNQVDFASKVAVPRPKTGNVVATQFANQEKPIMMALNIPTYVNLYGYGYRNVYELHELVKVNDRRIAFEGSIIDQKTPPLAPPVEK